MPLSTRAIEILGTTTHPTAQFMKQVARNVTDSATGFLRAKRHLIIDRDALFCSWGDYDRNQFDQDARHHRVTLPFRGKHLNLKKRFSVELGTSQRFGMAGALRRVGLPLAGTHHRGIDDCRNIARLARALAEAGATFELTGALPVPTPG